MNLPLSTRQHALLDAIPRDGGWHRIPQGAKAQTLLSLADRKLVTLKPRPELTITAWQHTYSNGYLVRHV